MCLHSNEFWLCWCFLFQRSVVQYDCIPSYDTRPCGNSHVTKEGEALHGSWSTSKRLCSVAWNWRWPCIVRLQSEERHVHAAWHSSSALMYGLRRCCWCNSSCSHFFHAPKTDQAITFILSKVKITIRPLHFGATNLSNSSRRMRALNLKSDLWGWVLFLNSHQDALLRKFIAIWSRSRVLGSHTPDD